MANILEMLEELDAEFKAAEVEKKESKGDFKPLPDGEYTVSVEKAVLKETKNGKPMVAFQFNIEEGEYSGRKIFKNAVISSGVGVRILKQDLYNMGIELESLKDLEGALEGALDLKLEVYKKTKGEYENVYINKVVGVVEDEVEVDLEDLF
jgi:hypothetical protein